MRAEIRVKDRDVRDALRRLAALGGDLSPAMRAVAGALEAGVEDALQGERSPDGSPWAPLSPVTQARRAARRKWPGRILQDSGDLAGSTHSRHGPSHAVAGTNLVYAAVHQFGAAKGRHGRSAA